MLVTAYPGPLTLLLQSFLTHTPIIWISISIGYQVSPFSGALITDLSPNLVGQIFLTD